MLRRNQILSILSFTFVLWLAIILHNQRQLLEDLKTSDDNLEVFPVVSGDSTRGHVIGIELGEASRVGAIIHDEYRVFCDNEGHNSIPSCFDSYCLQQPNFNETIATEIFGRVKTTAEAFYNQNITHAVISAPWYATQDETQRNSVIDAATRAGLKVIRIINEPTAAGIAYDLDKLNRRHEELFYIYFHLNSQSYDVALVGIERGIFEILAETNGIIGSEDFDRAVLEHTTTSERMNLEMDEADKLLSHRTSATIKDSITQSEIQQIHEQVFNETIGSIEQVLKHTWKGPIEKSKVEGIVLTGVPEQVSKVQPFIEKYFTKKVYIGINSDEVILHGVLKQVQSLTSDNVYPLMMDVTLLSLGIDNGGIFRHVIHQHTVIPTRKSITITTVTDNQATIIVKILEGVRPISSKIAVLGTLEIPVPPAPAGVPRIDVSFEVDADYLLAAFADDKEREIKVRVMLGDIGYDNRRDEDVVQLIVESAQSSEADKKAKQEIENGEFKENFRIIDRERAHVVKAVPSWSSWL